MFPRGGHSSPQQEGRRAGLGAAACPFQGVKRCQQRDLGSGRSRESKVGRREKKGAALSTAGRATVPGQPGVPQVARCGGIRCGGPSSARVSRPVQSLQATGLTVCATSHVCLSPKMRPVSERCGSAPRTQPMQEDETTTATSPRHQAHPRKAP